MSRTHPEGPAVGVGGIVRDGAGRVLLVQRGRDPGRGTWSFPGGHLRWGETLAEGTRREVWEETGIRVDPSRVLYVTEVLAPDPAGGAVGHHFVIVDLACEWIDGEARPGDDAAAVRWVGPEEVPALALTRGMAQALGDPAVRAFLGWPPVL
ncbi:MAG: NUDIX hydrolase [Actinomycetia bacterium]|nr:NUDIX hydrolase [Actinomycetes bacterium]